MKLQKLQQVQAGISAAYDELLKMSRLLMSVPLIFTVLVDETQETPFIRALICLLHECVVLNSLAVDGFDVTIFYSEVKASEQERVFYNLLKDEALEVVHWLRRLGYNLEEIRAPLLLELMHLSVEEPNTREQGLLLF